MKEFLVKYFGASWFTTVCGYAIALGGLADLATQAIAINGMPTDGKSWLLFLAGVAIKRTKMENVTNAAVAVPVPAKVIAGPELPLKTVIQEGQENAHD